MKTLDALETKVTDKEMEEDTLNVNAPLYTSTSSLTRDDSSVEYEKGKHDSDNSVKRDKKGYWLKNQSGNPKGRPPKGKSLAERFRENPTGEVVLKKIFEIASTLGDGKKQHTDALPCAKLVIERLVPALKSSELKMSTDDTGVIVMPAQIPAETDE